MIELDSIPYPIFGLGFLLPTRHTDYPGINAIPYQIMQTLNGFALNPIQLEMK